MEIFYSDNIQGGICSLGKEESAHCVRVLRHRISDEVCVIDGEGTMYRCRITDDNPAATQAMILDSTPDWGSHPYTLELAVCPTKNNDRFEWFMEKATEVGVDSIYPVIGEHSERKVFKTERAEKILLSATKQSLKAKLPVINQTMTVKEFIQTSRKAEGKVLKLIAYCFEDEQCKRLSIKEVLNDFDGAEIIIMIGPEGDFSKDEAQQAIKAGFIPVHLGDSRLRTETAALTACEAVYFRYMK